MKTYKSTATYSRINPKTGLIEPTSRFVEMPAANRLVVEAEVRKQAKRDKPITRVVVVTKVTRVK